MVVVLLALVFSGVHIAVALGGTAMLGIWLMTGDFQVVASFVGSTAYEAVRDYVFAVIPLFMLMGEFLAKCGAAKDLFSLFNRLTRIVPGRLAVATVVSNAVFAFVTGVSIAAHSRPVSSGLLASPPASGAPAALAIAQRPCRGLAGGR